MKQIKSHIIAILLLLLPLLVGLLLLSSCHSLRKIKSSVQKTEEVKKEEVWRQSNDSLSTSKEKVINNQGTKVVIKFDSAKDALTSDVMVTISNDTKEGPGVVHISSSKQPKSIEITSNKKQEQTKQQQTKVAAEATEQKTEEKKTALVEVKEEKKKFVFHWWFIIPAVIIFLIIRYRKNILQFIDPMYSSILNKIKR